MYSDNLEKSQKTKKFFKKGSWQLSRCQRGQNHVQESMPVDCQLLSHFPVGGWGKGRLTHQKLYNHSHMVNPDCR